MAKNILIFSDGTGQAGGLVPDERRSNVYKLFRATRCGPDSNVDPTRQLTFYDPGLGSQGDPHAPKIGWWRWAYNLASQMTGLGLTKNIVDCYAAVIAMWEPDDRIYLFGFSRGAYTVRCLGGVLALCGIPTTEKDGSPLKLDPRSVRAVARAAVKKVYQHGASKKQERFRAQRRVLAETFRKTHASHFGAERGAIPYFIGVWDTVAALGASWLSLIGFGALIIAILAFVSYLLKYLFGELVPFLRSFDSVFLALIALNVLVIGLWYLATHLKYAFGTGQPFLKTIHIVEWRLQFYDKNLDDRVGFARHALAIDENRKDFARVEWRNNEGVHPRKKQDMNWFEQVWFAGNHSDVGGSYSENECRLSDIALQWIANEARRCPYPLVVDESYLHLFPSSAGMQHDESEASLIPWSKKDRVVPDGAYLHPTVGERLALNEVRHFDGWRKYDPTPLRGRTFHTYAVTGPSQSGRAEPQAGEREHNHPSDE